MKLTKKSTKTEIETTETVCEITQEEFEQIGAETAAKTIVQIVGDDPDMEDLLCGVAMSKMFATYLANLVNKLFTDKNENPDKKEEK
jgi:hypothetical protein